MDLNVCRICGGTENLQHISEHDPEMVEKLSKCANIHIDFSDSLPKLICEQCTCNLEISYRLRKQSEKTQELLRQKLELNKSIEINKESASQQVVGSVKEEEEMAGNFILLKNENETVVLDEHDATSSAINICKSPKNTSCNDEETILLNLDSDFGNQSDIYDEFLLDDEESKTETKQPEASVVECTIDLLSSPSKSEESDTRHETIRDAHELSYTCYTCQNVFHSKKEYASHIKEHGSDRYQCIQCCKFFPTQYRLRRHEEVHRDDAIHKCAHCDGTYRGQHNLLRHVRTAHLSGKGFNCDVCNVCFSRKDVLKRHLLLHSDKKDYICSICSQGFKTKDYLNAHHKSHHETKDDECKNSKKQNISNGSKKYQCGYCGKLFKSSFPYKNHILIHTNEKPHECETCQKKFRTIAALTTHQRIHDDYRPYQCDVCLKSFKQTSHLREHKLLHLENPPKYTCTVCQSSFVKKGNLNAHMQTHAEEKPFKCAECTAEFKFMHLLHQHANKVHNRTISKEYDMTDTIDLVKEEDENNDICDETFEYNAVHFINALPEEDGIEEFITENPKPSVEFDMDDENNIEEPQISHDENQEQFIDCIHIDSSNSAQSLPTNETNNIESICKEEIHITEHKVVVFVNEET